MKSLNFDDGCIELAIQGDEGRLLKFNPTDYNMAAKFYDLMENAEKKQKELKDKSKKIDNIKNEKDMIEYLRHNDIFFKEELDKIFGNGSSELIFAGINVMTTASNGDFVITNFLNALIPYFEKESKSRIKKAVKKYKK